MQNKEHVEVKNNFYFLSCRMNPYSCMSTDNREGIIQVVLNAETIANIQRQKGMFSATCAFRKGSLLGEYNGKASVRWIVHVGKQGKKDVGSSRACIICFSFFNTWSTWRLSL